MTWLGHGIGGCRTDQGAHGLEAGRSKGSFTNIQALGAVAAIIVAFLHLQPVLSKTFHVSTGLHFGAFGVDIFFVISGFVMYISNRRMDRSIRTFLTGRFFRIVPLYWLATLLVVLLYILGSIRLV